MQKRGQFYLIGAILIVMVIFGIVTVRNYARTSGQETVVYDLRNELDLETGKVVDFSVYNKDDTNALIENWTSLYVSSQSSKDVQNWIFVYGNGSSVTTLSYDEGTAGTISIEGSGTGVSVPKLQRKKEISNIGGNNLNVKMGDYNYEFNLTEGQNFIVLISKEGYVATS